MSQVGDICTRPVTLTESPSESPSGTGTLALGPSDRGKLLYTLYVLIIAIISILAIIAIIFIAIIAIMEIMFGEKNNDK